MESLAENTYREFGAVRLLVNNAGIEQFGYLWDTPIANWQRVVDVNVSGVFHGVRAFLPRMMDSDEPAWVWNLSSVGGVVAIPLQAPYIMSKHAVLALTECLHLDVQSAGHADHIHVQAVLPGAVVSNIFESAGGVDTGDVAAANAQRSAMLRIKAAAMDPLAAAETVFDQSAAGKFYLLTQDSVGTAMDRAGEYPCCTASPDNLMTTPALDPDAAARVASFGDVPPMRQRGLAAIRAAIESAPLPATCPTWPTSRTSRYPGRAALSIFGSTVRQIDSAQPVLVYFHGGGLVMGSNHSFEPLARALASTSGATVVAVDYRLAPEVPPPAQFDDALAAIWWVSR